MIHQLLSPAKALRTIRKTNALLVDILRGVSQEQTETLRDGADGWSVLFVVCHLRDYEIIYRERIEAALTQERPTFTVVPNDELARRGAYAQQDLRAVLADLGSRRAELIARLEGLSDDQWRRQGIHPEQGPGTVLDMAINVGLHDVDHLEQIARCLEPLRRAEGRG